MNYFLMLTTKELLDRIQWFWISEADTTIAVKQHFTSMFYSYALFMSFLYLIILNNVFPVDFRSCSSMQGKKGRNEGKSSNDMSVDTALANLVQRNKFYKVKAFSISCRTSPKCFVFNFSLALLCISVFIFLRNSP